MTMRNVLVTGTSTRLRRAVEARLQRRPDVRAVLTTDRTGVALATLIDDAEIDTVIHAGMCPSRSGTATTRSPDLIATQQLTAAISGRDTPVRVVVAVSSTEAYDASSWSPRWRRELETLAARPDTDAALVLEGEQYLRALADAQPHISVAILRLADLTGPGTSGPLTTLWQQPVVPYLAGYDPPVQALHLDDAVTAIDHVAALELAGTFNIAPCDALTWRQTARLIGRPAVPAAIVPDDWSRTLGRLRVPCVPRQLADVLRFGRCVDTSLATAGGIEPRHSTAAAVRAAVARSRVVTDASPGSSGRLAVAPPPPGR